MISIMESLSLSKTLETPKVMTEEQKFPEGDDPSFVTPSWKP